MCGVCGLLSPKPIPLHETLKDALISLQHRGQDAAGFLFYDQDGTIYHYRNLGLVRDTHLPDLPPLRMALGHIRYCTKGNVLDISQVQPLLRVPVGFVHNGQVDKDDPKLSDSCVLFEKIMKLGFMEGSHSESHSEALLHMCRSLALGGVYACILTIPGHGLFAFQDPYAVRPLMYGTRPDGCVMVASESCALYNSGFQFISDISAGECLFVRTNGEILKERYTGSGTRSRLTPCIFEYVYLARADSIIHGTSVYEARRAMGRRLSARITKQRPDWTIDVVVPVPETSYPIGSALAEDLGIPLRFGFVKNTYLCRTFLLPSQKVRSGAVRQKLTPIDSVFRNKNVLLVDDSIVRGTTARAIVDMVTLCGSANIYFASAAPRVLFPNRYGIAVPDAEHLVARHKSLEEMESFLGVDGLLFQTLSDLEGSVRDVCQVTPPDRFEDSLFTGKYLTTHSL